MRAVLILFTALLLLTAGCAPQQPSGGSTTGTTVATGTPSGAAPAGALPVKGIVGSWVSTRTMEYSGVQIPATLFLSLNATGTLSVSARAELVGELFKATGKWSPTPDGMAIATEIEGSQSRGTLASDGLHWMNAVWTRGQPAKASQ